MMETLNVLLGLAGTGKTHFALAKMRERIEEGDKCIYLTFNKKLQISSAKKLKGTTSEVYTFHMFCYRALKEVGYGGEFDALMRSKESEQSYVQLIRRFLEVFSQEKVVFPIKNVKAVFIDEFQNLPGNLIPVASLLAKKLDAEFYVCGDPIQAIAHWHSKDLKHFENLVDIFGIEPTYLAPLRINHRSKLGPLWTINAFLNAQFPKWSEQISYTLPDSELNKEERTKVYIVTSPVREAELVIEKIKEVQKSSNPSIAVLARTKKQLEKIKPALEQAGYEDSSNGRISLATIHSYIGGEADVVFLIGVEIPEDGDYRMRHKAEDEAPDEARVLYVGLSRAREKLIVTSPCARADLETLFGDGVEIEDLREDTSWEKKRFPPIEADRENIYLTKSRYDLSTIDSISIKIDEVDVPWHPYIADKHPPSKWERQKSYYVDGIQLFVKRNLSHRYYIFTLSDTNTLKRSKFTDKDLLEFFKYAIFKFFNTGFSIDQARINRLDLCRLFQKDDSAIGRIKKALSRYPMIPVGKNGKIIEPSKASLKHTWYYHVRAHFGFQVVCYVPSNKTNGNQLYNDELYKIEVRLQGECLGKRGYSEGFSTLGQLTSKLASQTDLSSWYWKALRYAGFDNPHARKYTPPKSEWFFLQPGDDYDDSLTE